MGPVPSGHSDSSLTLNQGSESRVGVSNSRSLHGPDMTDCPESSNTGKRVERITLESLLLPQHRPRIGSAQWFFCPAPGCAVVYFDAEGHRLDKSALSVRVGTKESHAPRPVCYCFGHSFEEIQAEVAATGTSTIPDSITEKCRQGLHECERKNPQGTCCLGNVRAVLREAQASGSRSDVMSESDCCTPSTPVARKPVAGRLAAGGAVVSAVLSSACCWLPLVLLAFGVSAAGVSGFFERYRSIFLGGAVVCLAVGFYFVYRRKPACGPGEACSVPSPRLTGINRTMLWVATAFVAAFALFPNYVGTLLGTPSGAAAPTDAAHDLEFTVEGMTCEGCAAALRSKLAELPGVSAAEVLYASGRARLRFESQQARPNDEVLAEAVSAAGYRAVLP